jgi:pimeloyl-ACP methyl ester carboxylesterase
VHPTTGLCRGNRSALTSARWQALSADRTAGLTASIDGESESIESRVVFIGVNGHRVHAVSFGAGATTFLGLGGWVGNWEVWLEPFETLSTRWRCVAYDHRGSGETPVPPEALSPDGLIDDVLGVMDALSIDRCILAGESLGAVVAIGAALRAPERFTGLVLVDGAPAVSADIVRPLIVGSRADFAATLARFVDSCVPEPDSDHLKRWGRDMLRRSDAESGARILECHVDPPRPMPALGELRLPTLVIHGTADAIVPIAIGRMTAKAIRGATLVELDGAGHVPTVTQPAAVVRAITDFAAAHGLG